MADGRAFRTFNGSEMTSGDFQTWAKQQGVGVLFIQLGTPAQIAYIKKNSIAQSYTDMWMGTCSSRFRALSKPKRNVCDVTIPKDQTWRYSASPLIRN